ncbi:MAG: amidophosphoribosyltransferase [Limnothrix sp. RL_2_0]|nr:amidophosphoribosyltransferase [Limnothrix sp. RL_2_0]
MTVQQPVHDNSLSDKPKEYCGVFGIYAPTEQVAKLAYFGLFALQHRGQESAGIATFDEGKIRCHKDMGLVSHVFSEEKLQELQGSWAVGHNRYSTTGSSHHCNAQPALEDTRLGTLALAHNGNLVNIVELKDKLLSMDGDLDFLTTTDSEMIAKAIAIYVNQGMDWTEAAIAAFKISSGAYSLVIGTPDGIIGARDPQGVRPLVIGSFTEEDGTIRYALASETCALDIIGADYVRDVEPGEMVWITESGFTATQWAEKPDKKLCVFEMIYFARPDSVVHDETLFSYRLRLGAQLAKESNIEADLVMGVPDSGIPAAIGFSRASGISFGEGLIKNRYVGRTFIQPTQHMREVGIKMKLNPLKDVLHGKRIIIVDDSIVRGTTSLKIVRALRQAGAEEVHMCISSPPVTHPCFYGIDTDSQDHLIAATKSKAEIAAQIEVDSLTYLSKEGMLEVTKEDPASFCTACFDGNYPIEIPDSIKASKLILEKTTV